MKKIVLFILVLFAFSVLTGCNTFKGMGKDIKKLGEAIEESGD